MKSLPEAIDILVLFGIIMYALFTGVVTATEAAAAARRIRELEAEVGDLKKTVAGTTPSSTGKAR